MRKAEQIAIEEYGVPSLLLMENAATGFVSALTEAYGTVAGKKVHVFCGRGNNGGDGFAIARMLSNMGAYVFITLLCEESQVSGDAGINMAITKKMQIPFVESCLCMAADVIVDAIFGTGFYGETEGVCKEAIDHIHKSEAFVASVDIPSGVSADTGHAAESAVFSDLCVTFVAAKPGHLLFPGKAHIQKLVKTDISVPQTVINDCALGYDMIDKEVFCRIPPRCDASHKGTFGKAIAFVGSRGMSGAARLSANAILKSGAGMATAAIPEDILDTVAASVTAVMTYPLPKNAMSQALAEKAKGMDALLMGCGIGTGNEAVAAVWHMLTENTLPTVLDADGLNAVSRCTTLLKDAKCDLILTPHLVEFARISGIPIEEIRKNPVECARGFAMEYHVTLVLKDAVTIVATKNGHVYISTGSNSGMATAGSGDVLAGIITGLLAQGTSAETAAVCGVYLHLAAGQLARAEKGEYGMTAEDILEHLPYAFLQETSIAPQIKE